MPIGLAGAYVRGLLNYILDYDWRSQAAGFRFVRRQTRKAIQTMVPGLSPWTYGCLTALRFAHNSREEWQAQLFDKPVMKKIQAQSRIVGLDDLLGVQRSGRGIVLVSCHLDSFCMGMVLMGMNGLKIHCVNTRAGVEDPCIHPMVTKFLKAKYANMENLMSGRMEYHETNLSHFYAALEHGEAVALMGDVPGSKSTIYIDFAGKRIQLPLGAWHMAVRTNSLLSAYVCLMDSIGSYTVYTLKPFEPDAQSPEKSLRPAYTFMEDYIRAKPSRWVSSDIMSAYEEQS